MPCGDITERMRLTIDKHDRIDSYSLAKKTCGGAVGLESILLDRVGGLLIDEVIGTNELSFLHADMAGDDIETFLKRKHFFAIKSVLDVYLDLSTGGPDSSCTIAGIEFGSSHTVIDAELKIDLQTDRIESCDHCGPD